MSDVERVPKPIAARLSALMDEHDVRAEDIASDLHVAFRTVTRWLEGVTEPSPTLARALGARFEVDWRLFYEPATEIAA